MTGRRVWPMQLLETPSPPSDVPTDLGPVVKPLSVSTESATELVDMESLKVSETPRSVAVTPVSKATDWLTQLDEFSITLRGSHCVYGLLMCVLVGLGLYLWHLNSRIQGLEALIIASAGLTS